MTRGLAWPGLVCSALQYFREQYESAFDHCSKAAALVPGVGKEARASSCGLHSEYASIVIIESNALLVDVEVITS